MLFSIFGLFYIITHQNLTCSFFSNRIMLFLIVLLEFVSELGTNWFLVDNKGHRHVVKYNMDLCIPEICGGWFEFRKFYGLEGNHFVFFRYVGKHFFNITLFKGKSSPLSIYKFYDHIQNRCPLIHGLKVHFTIKIYVPFKPSSNFVWHFLHYLLTLIYYSINLFISLFVCF